MPSIRARVNAAVKVFQSIFWGCVAALICLAQLDQATTGAFLKDFVANDVLQMNNTAYREKAAEIARYKLFASGVVTSICIAIAIALFGIYFDIYELFQKEKAEQIREDQAISQLYFTQKLAQGQAEFHKDFKSQWEIQNEASSARLKEQILMRDQMDTLREDLAVVKKRLAPHEE